MKIPLPLTAWLGCKDDCPIAFSHKINDWAFTVALLLLALSGWLGIFKVLGWI